MVLESLFNLMDILQVKDGTLILFIKVSFKILEISVFWTKNFTVFGCSCEFLFVWNLFQGLNLFY